MSDVPIRVAVVDDQALVRMGLRDPDRRPRPDLELVGEAADGRAGLGLIRVDAAATSCCATSGCPTSTGSRCCARSTADASLADVRVVMLTTFELDEYVFEALRHGASGFLLKDTDPAPCSTPSASSPTAAPCSRRRVTRRVIEQFGDDRGRGVRLTRSSDQLTEREREIVALGGDRPVQPGDRRGLVVSPDTVRTHVSRAMVKLHARDRAQLVVFAMESGLTPPSP